MVILNQFLGGRASSCPFCGSRAEGRTDGPNFDRPFHIRCTRTGCPGNSTSTGFADPEAALIAWNMRVQPRPQDPQPIGKLAGFTKRDLIKGELIWFELDRTGIFESDAVAFSPYSKPLMFAPGADTPVPTPVSPIEGPLRQAELF